MTKLKNNKKQFVLSQIGAKKCLSIHQIYIDFFFTPFYFWSKLYFIYFLVLEFKREERKLLENKEIENIVG
jgi:hypothetical protein